MTDTRFPDEVATSLGDELAAIGAAFTGTASLLRRLAKRLRKRSGRTGPKHSRKHAQRVVRA